MEPEDSRHKRYPVHSTFEPMLLILIALLVMTGFQTSQLYREKTNLVAIKLNQEKPLRESRNVRAQFDSIATDTARLAAQGNQNAKLLLTQLKKVGVSVDP